MDKSPRDAKNAGLDLSQKWLHHLRQAAKTTLAHPCRFCKDRIYQSEELLWAHITETHPDEVPRDKEAQEKFQETLKGQIAGPMRSRYVLCVCTLNCIIETDGSACIVTCISLLTSKIDLVIIQQINSMKNLLQLSQNRKSHLGVTWKVVAARRPIQPP
jgi:hypothetical protein